MQPANINLSGQELTLVNNSEWLLMKNNIIDKVYLLMGNLQERLDKKIIAASAIIPQESKVAGPKIAKGEKYKGLPYVMLDYPRFFSKKNIFAFRSLFWWGHYFSCTLHLTGSYQEHFSASLKNHFLFLSQHEFYITSGKEEWTHDLEEETYIFLPDISEKDYLQILTESAFLKISKKFPLEIWGNFIDEAILTYSQLEKCLH
jgi:hypothetical protein